MAKSCFFIGHADAPDSIAPVLRREIERHISEYGVTVFYVGHYGGFDRLAAQALREAKSAHREITLYLVIPYHPAERPVETPEGFDGTCYPFDKPVMRRYAISQANRQMIQDCDYLIAYVRHEGKSRDFYEYAKRREKKGFLHTINLWESDC